MVNDKESDHILKLLPKEASYYFCKPNIPRGLEIEKLEQLAERHTLHGTSYTSVNQAYKAAKKAAKNNDFIFVGGSTFVVAEVL